MDPKIVDSITAYSTSGVDPMAKEEVAQGPFGLTVADLMHGPFLQMKELGYNAADKLYASPPIPADVVRDAEKYRAINTPEIHDFIVAVEREALHQRERWASEHDAGKTDADWFWLIGYLAGKALNKPEKQLHHIITTAAACLNWHAAALKIHTAMRPGIEPPIDSRVAERGGK